MKVFSIQLNWLMPVLLYVFDIIVIASVFVVSPIVVLALILLSGWFKYRYHTRISANRLANLFKAGNKYKR